MIIGRQHRYVFVQLPHTGCTAVATELLANYRGEHVLTKHSHYAEFRRTASADERTFFTFSTIRNPADEAVSTFYRYLTNHDGMYSNLEIREERGGWVTANHVDRFQWVQRTGDDFPAYFREFFRPIHISWSMDSHHRFKRVMRFERLVDDFADVLQAMGVPQIRPLPVVNRTGNRRREFWDYYTEDIRAQAIDVFGPYMRHWGYTFPAEWNAGKVPWQNAIVFRARTSARRLRALI